MSEDDTMVRSSHLLGSALLCALVEPDGRVSAASPGLIQWVPDAVGRLARDALGLDPRADLEAGHAQVLPGAFGNVDGGYAPVMVQSWPAAEGGAFVLVCDGTAFREAEEARWNVAVFGATRLTGAGRIMFVNTAGAAMLGAPDAGTLVGSFLERLLAEKDRPRFADGLSACMRNELVAPLTVTLQGGGECYVLLTPDRAPGGRTIGVIAVLQDRRLERARDAIKQRALSPGDWRQRLDGVLEQVRGLVPFDRATFGIFTENCRYFRAVHTLSTGMRPWPVLWMDTHGTARPWLESGKTWSRDLSAYAREHPEIQNDPVIRQSQEDGVRAFVALPVLTAEGPSCSLSLSSFKPDIYDQGSLALLHELDLAEILMMFEREIEDERTVFVRKLQAQIRGATTLAAAARLIVDALRRFFAWDQVCVIGAGTSSSGAAEFKTVAESSSSECRLPSDLSGPDARDIRAVLLRTLAANPDPRSELRTPVTIDDLRTEPGALAGQVPGGPVSMLTYPVRLNHGWQWILHVGATVANAFHGPDIDALLEIAAKLEAELERLCRAELTRVLLDRMPGGVVVVDAGGAILDVNRTARQLLDYSDGAAASTRLENYALDGNAQDVLSGKVADTSRRIELRATDGRIAAVLATRHDLAPEYRSSLWFLTDLDNMDWNVEYRYLREVVHDVAQQTRGPLILAAMQLQRALRQIGDEPTRKLVEAAVERTLAEIGKADITFERLAEGLSAIKEPMRETSLVELGPVLAELVAALPERDRRHIDLDLPEASLLVSGDAARLRFVLRSITAHLLRCRSDDGEPPARIIVKAQMAAGAGPVVMLRLSAPALLEDGGPQTARDPLWGWVQQARDDAGLALEAVEAVLAKHGACLSRKRLPQEAESAVPLWVSFEIAFPLARGS